MDFKRNEMNWSGLYAGPRRRERKDGRREMALILLYELLKETYDKGFLAGMECGSVKGSVGTIYVLGAV